MKISIKITTLIVAMLAIFTVTNIIQVKTLASSSLKVNNRQMANVAVIFFKMDDPYTMRVVESLKNLEKEKQNNVKFTFFDPSNNIAILNEMLDSALQRGYDLFILYLPDKKESMVEEVINRVKTKSIPLILMNIPVEVVANTSKLYNKVAFVTPNSKIAGINQGKIIVDLWNSNKSAIDKNGDNVLQYVLLKGPINDPQVNDRTEYAISTINDAGIKTEELAMVSANWSEDLAKTSIDSLFLKLYGKIEAIISNNDAMAIGAIESLQNYGYNKGDELKNIAIVGVDGLPEAKDLIDKGYMTGTVIQDPKVQAEFLYTVGMNLINNLNPTENTDYKSANGYVIIPFPYDAYTGKAK